MSPDARIAAAWRLSPLALELAHGLALAVRVEPGLLRHMRVHWLRRAGPETEADLWFGPLVELRTPTTVTFYDDVRQQLLDTLAARYREAQEPIEAARKVVVAAHAGLSPAVRLEEELAWYAVRGDTKAIDDTLKQVLIAYRDEDRRGLEQWAARAWGRLPAAARDCAAGAALLEIARNARLPLRLVRSSDAARAGADTLSLIVPRLRTATLAVQRKGKLLVFGDVFEGYSIDVPNTEPRFVELWPGGHGGRSAEWIAVESGDLVQREVGLNSVPVRTAAGVVYEIPPARVRLRVQAAESRLQLRLEIDGESAESFEVRSELFTDPLALDFQTTSPESPLYTQLQVLFGTFPDRLKSQLWEAAPLELFLSPMTAWLPWEAVKLGTSADTALGLARIVSRCPLQLPRPIQHATATQCLVALSPSGTSTNAKAERELQDENRRLRQRLERSGWTVQDLSDPESSAASADTLSLPLRLVHLGGWIRFARSADGVRLVLDGQVQPLADAIAAEATLPECVAIDCRTFGGAPGELYPPTGYPAQLDEHARQATTYALELLRRGVRAVVLTVGPASENEAGAPWEQLYVALAAGESIGSAVLLGRRRSHQLEPDSGRWAALQLYGDAEWTLGEAGQPAKAAEAQVLDRFFLARTLDQRLVERPGLFRVLETGLAPEPLTVDELSTSDPVLVFIHGEASSTSGTFQALMDGSNPAVREFFLPHYGSRWLAYQHHSLSRSPIENALSFARALPEGARLHLVTHSTGGLIGELLARSQRLGLRDPFEDDDYALLTGDSDEELALRQLSRVLAHKRLRVERFIAVAPPLRGSVSFQRALARSSTFIKALRAIPTSGRAFQTLASAILGFLRDPKLTPGIGALMPDAPLIRILNRPDVVTEADLSVVSGTAHPKLVKRVVMWSIGAERESDMIVDPESTRGGARRAGPTYRIHLTGPDIDHFSYFSNPLVSEAIRERLQEDPPTEYWEHIPAEHSPAADKSAAR